MSLSSSFKGNVYSTWWDSLFCHSLSEDYREETQGEIDTDDFIGLTMRESRRMIFSGKTFLEEIGRFENFDAGMTFTPAEWRSFSQSLRSYVMARRHRSKFSSETGSESILSGWIRTQSYCWCKRELVFIRVVEQFVRRERILHVIKVAFISEDGAKNSEIRQRRDWLYLAKNSLKLDADRRRVPSEQRERS